MPITALWVVVPSPSPTVTSVPVVQPAPAISTSLAHPFTRVESDFATLSGDDEIKAQIKQVLGTPIGTLPWRTDFGSDLERLRHGGNTPILRDTARVFVDDAIRKWVPGVLLVSVDATQPKANEVDLTAVVQINNKPQSLTQRL